MSRRAHVARPALGVAARWATLVAAFMLALSVYALATTAAAAADGLQGAPALRPEQVAAPTDPFSLLPPPGARCEAEGSGRSGADGWRWHTFIVEAGRDLSTLEFGPFGPGSDYDATDGQITAALISNGRGVWSKPPAEEPKGLIDPGELGGVGLDPSDYTLGDGRYLVGFACTDSASVTRQWWSLEVTVQTTGTPFLAAGAAEAASPEAAAGTTTTTVAAGASTGEGATTSVVVTDDAGPAASAGTAAAPAADEAVGPTGVSWAPLVALIDTSSVLPVGAWAALVVVLARISYLLARPLRVLPLPAL
ncbi:MAG: hypothetical protein ACOYXM_11395 [Actinomycetota bacterium]